MSINHEEDLVEKAVIQERLNEGCFGLPERLLQVNKLESHTLNKY